MCHPGLALEKKRRVSLSDDSNIGTEHIDKSYTSDFRLRYHSKAYRVHGERSEIDQHKR